MMTAIRLTPDTVRTRLSEDATDDRLQQLEHLLALERSRRQAIEQGMERLSERARALEVENLELLRRLEGALPEPI